jgi:hypothetical protein
VITQPQNSTHNVIQTGSGSLGNPTDFQPIAEVVNQPILVVNPFTAGAQDFINGDGSVNVIIVFVTIEM